MGNLSENQEIIKDPNQKCCKQYLHNKHPYWHSWVWEYYHYWHHTFLCTAYGKITPVNSKINTEKLTTPISPNLPIAILFKQIEDCQRFAAARDAAFTEAQLIRAAKTLVPGTSQYKDAYHDWIAWPVHQKTYNSFCGAITAKYLIQKELDKIRT